MTTRVEADARAADKAAAAPTPARPRAGAQLARVIPLVVALDAAMLALAVVVGIGLKFGLFVWRPAGVEWLTGIPLVDFGWVVPLWLLVLAAVDAYSPRHFARGADEFKTVLRGSLLAALAGSMLAYLVNYDMSRGYYLWFCLTATALLLGERYLVSRGVARARRAGRLVHTVVAVGGPEEVAAVDRILRRRSELGYRIVGASHHEPPESPTPVPYLGRPSDVVAACREVGADTVLVLGGGSTSADLRRIGWDLADSEIDLVVVPSLLDVAGPRIHMRPVSGLPLMHIEPPQAARAMRWGKAVFDRVVALLLLALLSPVMLAVAVAVKLETGGPVLFRHRRVGVSGREFTLWKFRSMVADAGEQHAALVESHGGPLLFKLRSDPRATRVGAFIRRYSLDELPQLFNVLAGTMSLVGPRPQVAAEVAQYDDAAHRRLLVRPGITGLWQVSGRSDLTWDEAVRLDLYYVDNWSMAGDLVILLRTLRAVLRHDGAY